MPLKDAIAEFVPRTGLRHRDGFAYVRGPMGALGAPGKRTGGHLHPGRHEHRPHEFEGWRGLPRRLRGRRCAASSRPSGAGRGRHPEGIFEWSHGDGPRPAGRGEGLDYVACKSMLGTDIMKTNPYIKQAEDPFTGAPVCLVPAMYPLTWPSSTSTTAVATAHRGPAVNDESICVAAHKVIVTCERIVDTRTSGLIPTRWSCPITPSTRCAGAFRRLSR